MNNHEQRSYGGQRMIVAILLSVCCALTSFAACAATGKLVVASREVPPFVIRDPDGALSGIAIELWRGIARELNLEFELSDSDLAGMLEGLADGSFDLAVAALTVTPDRELLVDFSHPFHTSGLGIAVPATQSSPPLLSRALSPGFLRIVGTLLLVLLAIGVLIWRLERRANPQHFGGTARQGIGSGFWWSAVTMTTVGYGDKAPVTPMGRLLAVFWMFFSIIAISGFTAAIASVFTVHQLTPQISGPLDLPGHSVGTVRASTSAQYLAESFISATEFPDIQEALTALAQGRLDAVVYDAPVLRYEAAHRLTGKVNVVAGTFQRQDYAIGLRAGSELREEINRALLERISEPEWQKTLLRYLGH